MATRRVTEKVSHLKVMQIEDLGQRWSCFDTLQARPLLLRYLDLDLLDCTLFYWPQAA
jgi:hypothetical protein